MTAHYPPAVISAIRAELAGNTRHDLITWARRVLRNPPTKAELARAQLVMAIDEGKA